MSVKIKDGTISIKVTRLATEDYVDRKTECPFPIGGLYLSATDDNPSQIWPGTSWVAFAQGRVLMGAGSYTENGITYTYKKGDTGGEVKHTLSIQEAPPHSHSGTANQAGNHYHGTYGDVTVNVKNSMGVYDSSKKYGGLSGFDWDNALAKTTTNGLHTHTLNISSTGGGQAHENRQPFEVVNFWKRTA